MKTLTIVSTAFSALLGTAWMMTAVAQPVPESVFYLKAQHSGKCAHQHGASQAEGAAVTQWECVDQPNVRIEKIPAGSGYFFLRFQHSGKCLTVEGDKRTNGTPIIQQTCNYAGPVGQTWMQLPGEGKYVKFQSTTGLCLHQHGNTTNNGDPITGWECVDQPNVRWEIVPYANTSNTAPSGGIPTAPQTTMIEKQCGEYADAAVAKFNEKVALEQAGKWYCPPNPNGRWQSDRNNHYGWCMENKAREDWIKSENEARNKDLRDCQVKPLH